MKIILLFTLLSAVIAIFIYRKGKREAYKIFDYDYLNLVKFIRTAPNEDKYYTIRAAIHRMRKTKGVNHEKLDVAECEFKRKYEKYFKK